MSVSNKQFFRKGGDKSYDRSEVRGIPLDPGPHFAIVKANADNTRRGSVFVWVEALGANEGDPNTWIKVEYASPYYNSNQASSSEENTFTTNKQSAGIWVPTPDIGTTVLVAFPSGDKSRGVWFACLPDRFNLHMTPGLASSERWDVNSDDGSLRTLAGKYSSIQPVGEINEKKKPGTKSYYDTDNRIDSYEKPINTFLGKIYKEQGLDQDLIRGHTTSSAQRETPSEVFGISTKGRRFPDTKDNQTLIDRLKNGGVEDLTKAEIEKFLKVKGRQPGHTFVMDDGDFEGNNQLVRLRSASGHQLLLHDTEGVIYVGNSKGTVWMEFSADGKLDIFSEDSVNVRSKNFNFYADKDMKFHAKNNISIKAEARLHLESNEFRALSTSLMSLQGNGVNVKSDGNVNISSGGEMNIKASSDVKIDGSCIDIGNGAASASGVSALSMSGKTDIQKDSVGFWDKEASVITIVDRLPTHEPFKARNSVSESSLITAVSSRQQSTPEETAVSDTTPTVGKTQAKTKVSTTKLKRGYMIRQPEPNARISGLSSENTKKLLAMLGQRESNHNYSAENQFGFIGKYQFGLRALEDVGYIRQGITAELESRGITSAAQRNRVLNDPNVWTEGFNKRIFLADEIAQEDAIVKFFNINYDRLAKDGVITQQTSEEDIAGFLMAAHLVGSGNASKWAKNGGTFDDANGTTADEYYNLGRAAVA